MSYSNPAAYQRFMGRWSARLAPSFIRFAGVEDGQRVLDVGSGTGSLSAALLLAGPAIWVVGVDPVPAYVAFARQAVRESRAEFQTSAVEQLPFPDAAFDAVLACLVLQEVADPARALLEMARVTRAGGRVAACQWDFEGGLPMQSIFWGAAEALVPAEVARRRARDNAIKRAGPQQLTEYWTRAGLRDVRTAPLQLAMRFASFEDYCSPSLPGRRRRPPLRRPLTARARASWNESFAAELATCRWTAHSSFPREPWPSPVSSTERLLPQRSAYLSLRSC